MVPPARAAESRSRPHLARHLRAVPVVLATVVLVTGCGGTDAGTPTSRAAERRSWVLDGPRAGDPASNGVVVALVLDGGRISATMSCNRGGGDYTWDGDRLVLGQFATTLAGCADDDRVAAVTTVLHDHPLVTVDGSTMTMTADARTISFREVADDASVQQHDLEGTWTVLTPAGVDVHVNPLTFDATGRYQVIAGCGSLGGRLVVVGGRLSAAETTGAAVDAAACVTPTGMTPQEDPVAHVVSAAHLRRVANGLEVLDTSGTRVAILEPASLPNRVPATDGG